MLVAVVDYGMGNLRSVYNKFKKLNIQCVVTSDKEVINKADKLVLPGVGHFKYGMQKLQEFDLIEVLNEKVLTMKVPILGICLGTQLFAKHSEEGDAQGLGWIDAEVKKFKVSDEIKFKVPHMGWNNVEIVNSNYLNEGLVNSDQFYFVHSYHLICNDPNDVWMTTVYDYKFVSAVRRQNIFGTQFHPEKSHNVGFELLKRFAEI